MQPGDFCVQYLGDYVPPQTMAKLAVSDPDRYANLVTASTTLKEPAVPAPESGQHCLNFTQFNWALFMLLLSGSLETSGLTLARTDVCWHSWRYCMRAFWCTSQVLTAHHQWTQLAST